MGKVWKDAKQNFDACVGIRGELDDEPREEIDRTGEV